MNNKLLVTFNTNYTSAPDDFVAFWKNQYAYLADTQQQAWYYDNIKVKGLTTRNLYDLYCWKNGMNLSSLKQVAFHKIAANLDIINSFRNNGINDAEFEQHFGWISAIWKIFLRHIINPETYPIFDQHVYRAYRYIHRMDKDDLFGNNKLKERVYFQEYIPFYLDLKDSCTRYTTKEIDDAVWAFGRFLSLYPNMIL